MQDVTDGNINCVIVKDLSRLGREYIETGQMCIRDSSSTPFECFENVQPGGCGGKSYNYPVSYTHLSHAGNLC